MNPRIWGKGIRLRIDHRKIPAAVLALIYERQGYKFCVFCRDQGRETPASEPLEVDHKQPLSEGGDYHHLNLQIACRAHNRGRGARRNAPAVPTWARGPR